jgi:hypothetical protein
MPCAARIFAFIRSPCAHAPQKSWCAFTTQSFHTAWTQTGHSYQAFGQREQLSGSPDEVKSSAQLAWRELVQRAGQEAAVGIGGEPGEGVEQIILIA